MRGPPAAPLASHFNSLEEVEKPGRVKRCASYLSNPEMHLYFHFISFIVQPLNDFNTMSQADESKIGYLKDEITFLLRKFMGKFDRRPRSLSLLKISQLSPSRTQTVSFKTTSSLLR